MGYKHKAECSGSNLVRFACERHLASFPVPGPRPGTLAWCARCGDWRKVTMVVTTPNRAVCGKRATWVIGSSAEVAEVVCTEPRGHPADKHYDESFGAYFPDRASYTRLRYHASRALPAHGDDIFTALDQ